MIEVNTALPRNWKTAVWKYPLQEPAQGVDVTYTYIDMPADAEIISCQLQHNIPTLWALVADTTAKPVRRRFAVYMTGERLKRDLFHRYIDTVLLDNGAFVVHVFEVIEQN